MRTLATCAVVALLLGVACSGGPGEPESVVVPGVRSAHVELGYRMLHNAGLLVEIPEPFKISPRQRPTVRFQNPVGGTVVESGSVVRITELREGAIASIDLPRPTALVPDFVGGPVSKATAWAADNLLLWSASFPPLPPSNAPTLFDAYLVTAQQPDPGSLLTVDATTEDGYRDTPLLLEVAVR